MVAIRRGDGEGSDAGERLPWLEPVEDEDDPVEQPGGYGGVILVALAVLAAIAIITGAVLWFRHARAAEADIGQIIRAPTTPYKVRPADPGGLKPDANGEVAYRTSEGQDIDAPLDLGALPEQPVVGPGSAPRAAAPAPAPAMPTPPVAQAPAAIRPAPVATVPPPATVAKPATRAEAKPAPAGGGGTIQLGAFSSNAKAVAAWKALSGRFGFLADMTNSIAVVKTDSATLYRLRASGGGPAARLCAQLRVAGEACSVVGE